jgi:hypothetical protein
MALIKNRTMDDVQKSVVLIYHGHELSRLILKIKFEAWSLPEFWVTLETLATSHGGVTAVWNDTGNISSNGGSSVEMS